MPFGNSHVESSRQPHIKRIQAGVKEIAKVLCLQTDKSTIDEWNEARACIGCKAILEKLDANPELVK